MLSARTATESVHTSAATNTGETIMETKVEVFTDDDGHQHYHFVIDKEHMEQMQNENCWTEEINKQWEAIRELPEDSFFKKAYAFTILVNLLLNVTHRRA